MDLIAREAGRFTKIFPAALAKAACSASPSQPRHAHSFIEGKAIDLCAKRSDPADDLMPGNNGKARVGQFAVDEVQVRAANPAGLNADLYLPPGSAACLLALAGPSW